MKKRISAILVILMIVALFASMGGAPTLAQGPDTTPTPEPSSDTEVDHHFEEDDNPFAGVLGIDHFGDGSASAGRSVPGYPTQEADLPPQDGYSGPFAAMGVSTGLSFSCALTTTGGVKCWGDNANGKLGDGTITNRLTPVNVVGLSSGVIAISSSYKHTCALTSAGGVKCWGYNLHGELGDGTSEDRSTPVEPVGLSSGVVSISAGGFHTCALMSNGGVKCWGANWHGQVGDGSTTHRYVPVDVDNLHWGAKAVSTGKYHSCAIDSSNGVVCWGYNTSGQIGDDTNVQKVRPVGVKGVRSGVAAISLGGQHSCLLTTGGKVKCWGENSEGQLGDDTKIDSWTPINVTGLDSGITAISGGGYFTCARYGSSVLKCWGSNWAGQLGDGTNLRRKTPVDVIGLSGDISKMDTGDSHTCAITSQGMVKCWGSNAFGQLGDGNTALRLTPVGVSGLNSGIPGITAGGSHSCALTPGGGVVCWGNNYYGQLGDGSTVSRLTPVPVYGISGAIAVTTGEFHSCALLNTGGVKCWGNNKYGQLGNKSTVHSHVPVDVKDMTSGIAQVVAGDTYTCAVSNAGRVACWGDNFAGQLGDGTKEDSLVPIRVKGLSDLVAQVAARTSHTCALTRAGGVLCWGSNIYGKLGDGTTTNRLTPVSVVGLNGGAVAITLGSDHSCVLTASHGVKCWGSNVFSQLGNGSGEESHTPTDVTGLTSGVAAMDAGGIHTCALLQAGGIKCWGNNWTGQLGDGTTIARSTPVSVAGLSEQVSVLSAGLYHTCIVTNAGAAMCWGTNGNGQIGDGTLPWRVSPTDVSHLEDPRLAINYSYGAPGSYFAITGENFTPGLAVTVYVNGAQLSPTVPVDSTGKLAFILSTASAGVGQYGVTVSSNVSKSTSFSLIDGAPVRLQEGSGPILTVPAGIAFTNLIYLPVSGQ